MEPGQKEIDGLLEKAMTLGASEAAVVQAGQIRVQEKLAELCVTGCPNYRASASCPPAVEGPAAFRAWVMECRQAVVVRIDVPMSVLLSSERSEFMALLHEVVSGVESLAHTYGYVQSRAFAGGSCKELFCSSYPDCQAITTEKGCRNPAVARPSMSGFGIDVGQLMHLAQWPDKQLHHTTESSEAMSWIAGLILIG